MNYILDGHTPKEVDLDTWARWMQEQYEGEKLSKRHVAHTTKYGHEVSTVFLGIDYSFGGGRPILFETMIFGRWYRGWNEYQERCSTWAQAEKMHKEALLQLELMRQYLLAKRYPHQRIKTRRKAGRVHVYFKSL